MKPDKGRYAQTFLVYYWEMVDGRIETIGRVKTRKNIPKCTGIPKRNRNKIIKHQFNPPITPKDLKSKKMVRHTEEEA